MKENLTKKYIDDFIDNIKKAQTSFKSLNYDKEALLNDYNYVLTGNAKERLDKLYTYISNGIPVLLDGETGCSKTLSAEIICKIIKEEKRSQNILNNLENNKDFIKFNLSSEITINDLIKKVVGDKNSLSGLKIKEGPFFKAFKEGIPLILDEINLASEEVLQCIKGALDKGEINTPIQRIGLVNQKKKEGFCLIATQNPNTNYYLNKRQNLSQNFLSHFQIIKFPCFEIEELKEIAENLFKSFNNNEEGDEKDKQFIQDLISIHKEWTSKEEIKSDIICFTIREIAATIKAYIDESKKNAFKIVKAIYCSRYTNKRKNELLDLIGKYSTFTNDFNEYKQSGSKFQIPEEIKYFHKNKSVMEVLESALLSLEKKRNIIIVGKGGAGKSSVGREISEIYNLKKGIEKNNYYHYIGTEETKCPDLIGYIAPKKDNFEWKEGFLSKAIEKGEIVILDNLQEANSVITERLNSLLDIKYDENKKKATKKEFDIPENPLKDSIVIHDNFRIIGICDINNIMKMSPAFLNRFDIIVLENQLEKITKDEFQNLINILLTREEEIKNENNNYTTKIWPFSSDKDENKFIEKEIIINEKINYITNKFFDLISKEEEKFSIKDISRFCYSLELILKNNEILKAPLDKLIDFIYDLLFSEEEISIKSDDIKNILSIMLKKKIKSKSQFIEQFIFDGNESLENYLLIIFASYLIKLHLCIIGQHG